MNRLVVAVLAIGLLAACKSGHKKQGGGALTYEDFRELFPKTSLPYKLSTDSLSKEQPDSLALDTAAVSQFLTDTLAGPGRHVAAYYPVAYIAGKDVNYFVVQGGGTGYLCFADKKGHYLSRMIVARQGKDSRQYFSIDAKNLIKVTTETNVNNGHTATKEDFYAVSASGATTLIMTNSTGDPVGAQLFNPIDTLPAKNKLSGDYEAGEMNMISIRDGADAKSFQFFISFSKESGSCKGELLGTGRFTSATKGEYRDKETECGLDFVFNGSKLSVKEMGGCGAYRGIKCFFEGSFTKKAKK
jgi:hypothetical protein